MLHQKIKLFFYFTDRRISFLLTFTCRSKTDRTMKIAALCNFQNHTAAFSFMFLAEPAVIRTGLFFTLWIYRSLSRQIFSSPGEVICYTSLPDQCPEFPMKITFLCQINPLFTYTFFSRKYLHTYRTDAFRFTNCNQTSIIPRSVSISITFMYVSAMSAGHLSMITPQSRCVISLQ